MYVLNHSPDYLYFTNSQVINYYVSNPMNHTRLFSCIIQIPILYILTGCGNIAAQEVISTAGDTHSDTNGSISYTIGEPVKDITSLSPGEFPEFIFAGNLIPMNRGNCSQNSLTIGGQHG